MCLTWEEQQEGKHEFDGLQLVPRASGSVAHQDIVFNLRVLLARLLTGSSLRALREIRLRIGQRIRYPDVLVCAGPVSQVLRTLDDATIIFELLSGDTAATDRVEKLIDYADVPSLQYYIMLEQSSRAAIVCKREAAGTWTMNARTADAGVWVRDHPMALAGLASSPASPLTTRTGAALGCACAIQVAPFG